ncbi:hypothetical protein Q6294_30330, partial [Klebsiella pneumoniae]|nr:hypothetical protein [Klebsiella pneumoniae]
VGMGRNVGAVAENVFLPVTRNCTFVCAIGGSDRIVVFQEFDQLPPWKTVKQNVMFPLLASNTLKRHEAEERALHYLEKVGLSAFADAYPH